MYIAQQERKYWQVLLLPLYSCHRLQFVLFHLIEAIPCSLNTTVWDDSNFQSWILIPPAHILCGFNFYDWRLSGSLPPLHLLISICTSPSTFVLTYTYFPLITSVEYFSPNGQVQSQLVLWWKYGCIPHLAIVSKPLWGMEEI
jgi:hypothetical protein